MVDDKKLLEEDDSNNSSREMITEPMLASDSKSLQELRNHKMAHDYYSVMYKLPKSKIRNSKEEYLYYYTNYISEV